MLRLLFGILVFLLPEYSICFGQESNQASGKLTARILAVGIPGASAVAPVGTFHKGGPIYDKPEFASFTQPGQILDPKRILVTSHSNFGAPLAQTDAAEGAVLSLDPDGPPLVIPKQFATSGKQARALEGRVQLFTAQSPEFLNSIHTPGAASAAYPSVSNPIGISINNGFGRLWFSNTPFGAQQVGTESIVDPTGEPLNNAPSKLLGGIFAGSITNRSPQLAPGALNSGSIASALLGMSPDGSKRAVFAVLTADGSLAQVHTEFALDGLAPPATIAPIAVPPLATATQTMIAETTKFASNDFDKAGERLAELGSALFSKEFGPADGLGPLYNARSCLACHQSPTSGGVGLNGLALVSRVAQIDHGSSAFRLSTAVPVARARTIAELGFPCRLTHGPPADANVISLRNAAPLYGLGLIDEIADEVILANAALQTGIKGRPNLVKDRSGRENIGRFGWKGDVAHLEQFVADAFRNEIGITSPLAPQDVAIAPDSGCGPTKSGLDDDGSTIRAVTAYLAALPAPLPERSAAKSYQQGEQLFSSTGCVSCHTPALPSRRGEVALYSDLLLHDMGSALNDGIVQSDAVGAEWRTTPLWGLRLRTRFLHDGRAATFAEAILAHDGDGAAAARAFRQLPHDDRNALLDFLSVL